MVVLFGFFSWSYCEGVGVVLFGVWPFLVGACFFVLVAVFWLCLFQSGTQGSFGCFLSCGLPSFVWVIGLGRISS